MPSINARIPEDEAERLEDVAELLGDDRSTTIQKALREVVPRDGPGSPSSTTSRERRQSRKPPTSTTPRPSYRRKI